MVVMTGQKNPIFFNFSRPSTTPAFPGWLDQGIITHALDKKP